MAKTNVGKGDFSKYLLDENYNWFILSFKILEHQQTRRVKIFD